MSKHKTESKGKPVQKGAQISSANSLAKAGKGAGTSWSEEEEDLKRVSGGIPGRMKSGT